MSAPSLLPMANILICSLICLRIIFYRRGNSLHRPVASLIAYIIAIAAAATVIDALSGTHLPSVGETVLHGVFCLALFAARGNVTDLFRTTETQNKIHQLMRRTFHA